MTTKYEAIPVASEVITLIEVVAPVTMAEGYEFEALYQGKTFKVKVPAGGVIKGQRFNAPFQHGTPSGTYSADAAPAGFWKKDLCGCCSYGICHPSFLMAWCCSPVLLSQVMTRMNLNSWASPGTTEEVSKTFKYISIAFIINVFLSMALTPGVSEDGSPGPTNPIVQVCNALFYLFVLVIGIKTRAAVRARYQIPTITCGGAEDCCCMFWCGCCTVSQLATQTADYDTTQPEWTSETGLKRAVPILTV